MNDRDFDEWIDYHGKVFPSFESWFLGRTSAEILSAWKKAMTGVPLADAIAATDAMLAGVLAKPYHDELPATVRAYHAQRRLDEDREERRKVPEPDGSGTLCGLCRNTGQVTCWNTLVVRGVLFNCERFRWPRDGSFIRVTNNDGTNKRMDVVCPCRCGHGDRFRFKTVRRDGQNVREEVPRYDPKKFLIAMTFRTAGERKTMTIREQVLADCELAGVSRSESF